MDIGYYRLTCNKTMIIDAYYHGDKKTEIGTRPGFWSLMDHAITPSNLALINGSYDFRLIDLPFKRIDCEPLELIPKDSVKICNKGIFIDKNYNEGAIPEKIRKLAPNAAIVCEVPYPDNTCKYFCFSSVLEFANVWDSVKVEMPKRCT